jgi:Zn finger protein HypA/HybF involved in hydrogenase expression
MKLREFVVRYCLIELRCGECRSHTALDPAFFLARRGDIESSELAKDMVCPACGSQDISLHAVSPVQAAIDPEEATGSANSARRLHSGAQA